MSSPPILTYPNLRETFQRSLPILEQHGIGSRNVRRSAYLKFLEDWHADQLHSYDPDDVTQLLRELHEIAFVLETFVTNKLPLPGPLLRAAFEGSPLPFHDPERDKSRNYMLHLHVAIYFLRLGYDVALDRECDVVAGRGKKRFFVECKRLYSERKVCARAKEAYHQVLKRLAAAGNSRRDRGIVWLDPSPIMLRHCQFYMAFTRTGALQAARYDLIEFRRRFIGSCSLPQDKRVAALVLQMVWPSRSGLDAPITTGFTSLVTPGHPRPGFLQQFFLKRFFHQLFALDANSALS